MAKFYRVHSRIPAGKPTLTIDLSLDAPPAEGQAAPSKFTESYSALTRSFRRAYDDLKAAKKAHPFGQHTLQEVEVDPGAIVETNRGPVVTR